MFGLTFGLIKLFYSYNRFVFTIELLVFQAGNINCAALADIAVV